MQNAMLARKHSLSCSLSELESISKCQRCAGFVGLNLKTNERAKKFFARECFNAFKECVVLGYSRAATLENVENFILNNMDEVFSERKKEFVDQFKRLINSFFDMEYDEVFSSDVPYRIALNGEINGVMIDSVVGSADLVCRKGFTYEVILFKSSAPKYSYKARKPENLPQNALELIMARLGLMSRFEGRMNVSLWHLKSKKDSPDNLAEFENKAGDNIISYSFDESPIALIERVVELLSRCEHDCSTCNYKSICREYVIKDGVSTVPGNKKALASFSPTKSQLEVINHTDGPMSVVAVPGAGKTKALCMRVVRMIKDGVLPSNILLISFTKKAVAELRERIANELGVSIDDKTSMPLITTFNGLGYDILRANPSFCKGRTNLATNVDRFDLIWQSLLSCPKIKGLSYEGPFLKFGIVQTMNRYIKKIDEVGFEAFEDENSDKDIEGIKRVYTAFKALYMEGRFIDYDEQVSLCVSLFEEHENILRIYQNMYKYIMVDEFQDCSIENFKLCSLLAKEHKNLVVVGDDDQSIYGFRGGSNKFMMEFNKYFPSAKYVFMEDNFRSNDKILNAASEIIIKNEERLSKSIRPHEFAEFPPILLTDFTKDRLPGIVKQILNKGYNYGDIAIIGRYNKILTDLADVLAEYPVSSPKDYLIDDNIFVLLTDILTLYYNGFEYDEEALYRVVRFLGGDPNIPGLDSLYSRLITSGCMEPMNVGNVSADVFNCVVNKRLAEAFRIISSATGVEEIRDVVLALTDIEHPVVDCILDVLADKNIVSLIDAMAYFEKMRTYSDEVRIGDDCENSIKLLTAHDSKGKEYPVVILYGLEDFPSDSEEETRLLFVALTRAKRSLFITKSYGACSGFVDTLSECCYTKS